MKDSLPSRQATFLSSMDVKGTPPANLRLDILLQLERAFKLHMSHTKHTVDG